MECIVLAGGLGTRLRGVIGDQPKCMAPVRDRPFLGYLLDYLSSQGCRHVIFSLGYRHEVVTGWLEAHSWPFRVSYVVEEEPLGTGGGIRLAMAEAEAEQVLVVNGDTMFRADLAAMLAQHRHRLSATETTLALKPMKDFDRYGVVRLGGHNIITAFEEKRPYKEGLINGGIYALSRSSFMAKDLPVRFSFEQDYLERLVKEGVFSGYVSDGYFIDIGIPSDYERAWAEL